MNITDDRTWTDKRLYNLISSLYGKYERNQLTKRQQSIFNQIEKAEMMFTEEIKCSGCGSIDDGSDKWSVKSYEGIRYCVNCADEIKAENKGE